MSRRIDLRSRIEIRLTSRSKAGVSSRSTGREQGVTDR